MRKLRMAALCMCAAAVLAACGTSTDQEQEQKNEAENTSTEESTVESVAADSAVALLKSGNPAKIALADIAEETDDAANAWIKIATQYDPDLTVYSYDTLATGTIAIEVVFEVSNFDCGETTLYWCYQLTSGGTTTSVWDTSSPTDTLTITGDGTYRLVFDANAALGGAIEEIESFQMVFPCTMDTGTVVTLTEAKCITDEADLEVYVTGALE